MPTYLNIAGIGEEFRIDTLDEDQMGFKLEMKDSLMSAEVKTMQFTISNNNREEICQNEWKVKF